MASLDWGAEPRIPSGLQSVTLGHPPLDVFSPSVTWVLAGSQGLGLSNRAASLGSWKLPSYKGEPGSLAGWEGWVGQTRAEDPGEPERLRLFRPPSLLQKERQTDRQTEGRGHRPG